MKYGLLRCYPAWCGSGNNCLAECVADNLAQAIPQLQPHCPAPLNERGYVKIEAITFVIAEVFGS